MSDECAHRATGEDHAHDSDHGHDEPAQGASVARPARVLTIRAHSGLSGDIVLAGLLRMTETDGDTLDALLASILPDLAGSVRLVPKQVNHIGGWHALVSLPHQHAHRTLGDMAALIAASGMSETAKRLAMETFVLLAGAEGAVHGKKPEEVHFHEVGALDSILDICASCELFTRLAPERFVVSPLPLADGEVTCAHGVLPVPAPAVLEMLEGVPVRPFSGRGETVTPTALALLKSLRADFGPWPAMRVERRALVYGTRVFAGAPNGAVFAWGPEEMD